MKNNKAENLREKLKQALTSTARVISDDIHLKNIDEKNKKDLNFVDIETSAILFLRGLVLISINNLNFEIFSLVYM